MSDDEVIVKVGNPISSPNGPGRAAVNNLTGWQSVRIQRSCEAFPSAFELTATERFPGDNINFPVSPGDPATVSLSIGYTSDPVITGYVDRVVPSLSPEFHAMTIIGRSKCGDLVDCSATGTTQFNNSTPLAIAQKLAQPFGITVSQTVDPKAIVPQLVFNWGETPYELIERIARFAGMLVYDGADGNLILGRVSDDKMATGVVEGKNLLRGTVTFSMDERFSQYTVRRLTFDPVRDNGVNPEGDIVTVIPDAGVSRFRPRYIIAETPTGMGLDYAKQRGYWEANRRFGRSAIVNVTVDSWRDGEGNLWEPNKQIDLQIPTLKLGTAQNRKWVIATVCYRRDHRGTEADLTIMPTDAFDVLPVPLTPLVNDL